jgi:3-methyladenine DNA glycosylase AlkC
MAELMKDSFNAEVVGAIADSLPVDHGRFLADCLDGFDQLELMARGQHVAAVMKAHLSANAAIAINQVAESVGPPFGFGYLAHSAFIGTYGLPAFDESMAANYALTKVFTAEFSIRPFLLAYPETMGRLHQWVSDHDEHVRRLVSEGTRPRLPWATRLPMFQTDPAPVVELLDRLKDDPSDYVQRSVGNNLNDISHDNPDITLAVAEQWLPGRARLVRRGLRTLIKAADPKAMELLGYGATDVTVSAEIPAHIHIGERLPLQITLVGTGAVLVDVRVHYIKANGSTSVKVFRGGEVKVTDRATLRKTISFAHHTTRRQYPGPHHIEALLNGRIIPLGVVIVE